MNFRRLSDKQLADFAANVSSLLGGVELKAINTAVRTALVAEIGTAPADLSAQSATASVAVAEKTAAVSTKNATRDQVVELMSQVKSALLAGRASKDQFDLCGFDFRAAQSGPYVAQDPTELSAFGFSNGVNQIKFKGNNRVNSVVFEVWRRQGDTGAWALLATTRKQLFTDSPVTPGQYYEYRVRAKAAKSISHFSNSSVVYGVQ